MIHALTMQSDGISGRVTWLIGSAAEITIDDGSEQIDVVSIERVSERLRSVAI